MESPYIEYSTASVHSRRGWLPTAAATAGVLALVSLASVVLTLQAVEHANAEHTSAALANAERLAALLPRLEAATALRVGSGAEAVQREIVPHKFALDGVTPTDFQLQRGDCWLFATVGLLEDSYRRQGVARGWLKPNEYLHLSRQAFGVAVLDACRKHTQSCLFDGDSIYTGNSTTGGEVELIYYLKEVGLGALPVSVCPYISTPIADRKCDGRHEALKSNPLKFTVHALKTYYNRQDIKAALVASKRALSLSTSMILVPFWLPCTSQVAAQYRCDPADVTTCHACPLERAYAGVSCCVMVNRSQYTMKAEWFHRAGEPIIKEGGHSIALVGWNDEYRTEQGLVGGWIIRNSWEDGLGLSHGAPARGSRSLGYFMQDHSDLDEATVCPNSRDPRSWYPCTDVAACSSAQTVQFARSAHKVLRLQCIDTGFFVTGACERGELLYLKDHGGGYGISAFGGGLSVACFIRASGAEFCMPPLPVDDLATIVQPAAGEELANRKELCGFYFVPYETLETMSSALGGVWVSDLDVEWAAESYAANEHTEAAQGKDYTLVKRDTFAVQPPEFSGPLPHLTVPID